MEHILHLIGLAKKAGRLEVGEEPVGAVTRAHHARLVLVAKDATAPTVRRAAHFAQLGSCLMLSLPADKDALGAAVGRTSCAMVAVTDIGLATAIAKKLAALDGHAYAAAAAALEVKAARAQERKREAEQHEKNRQIGKVKKVPPKETPAPSEPEKTAPVKPAKTQTDEKKIPKPSPYRGKRPSDAHRSFRSRSDRPTRRADAPRFSGSRPVKHGKGSGKKNAQ